MELTGANVTNITKITQGDIFRKTEQTVVGMVTVPENLEAGEAVKMGTLLHTSDGGLNWSTKPNNYQAGSYSIGDEVYDSGNVYESLNNNNTDDVSASGSWANHGEWNPNGILFNDITETKKTTVAVTTNAKEKYLTDFDEFLRPQLFNNKLIID